jgi:hypothetical protein
MALCKTIFTVVPSAKSTMWADVAEFLADNQKGLWVADLPWSTPEAVGRLLRGEVSSVNDLSDARHDLNVFCANSVDQLGPGFRHLALKQ